MKRIVLFVLTNLAAMVVLSIVLKVFGIDRAMVQEGFKSPSRSNKPSFAGGIFVCTRLRLV